MANQMGPITQIPIDVNTIGANVLVPGQAGYDVLVINLTMIAFGAVNVTLEDVDGTDRMGPYPFAANGGIALPDSGVGWGRTADGQGLNARLSAGVRVGGSLTYRYIPTHLRLA